MTSTTATTAVAPGTAVPRRWFLVDAVVTGVNALGYVVAAGPVSRLTGADPGTVRALGIGLLVFAALVALTQLLPARTVPGWGAVGVNVLWVVASSVVAVTGGPGLSGVGRLWTVAQAVVIGVLAGLQVRDLGRAREDVR